LEEVKVAKLFDLVSTTGHWWEAEELQRYISTSGSPLKDQMAIDRLVLQFPAEWAINCFQMRVRNTFFYRLIHQTGSVDQRPLIKGGWFLGDLASSAGFDPVFSRVKRDGRDSFSAWLELDLALMLHAVGYEITFPSAKAKNGKTPDIIAVKGSEEFVIECKSLQERAEDAANEDYGHRVAMSAIQHLPHGWGYQMAIKPLEWDPAEGERHIAERATAASAELRGAIQAAVAGGSGSFDLSYVQGVVSPGISREDSRIALPGYSPYRWWHKVLNNGILPAAEQISQAKGSGMAVILVPYLPERRPAQAAFSRLSKENPSLLGKCTGVLLFSWANITSREPPALLINPHAEMPFMLAPAALQLAASCGAAWVDSDG